MFGARLEAIAVAAIFVVAVGVYVATLAPTVFLIDSGALTIAAWSRGSAHPPGFPLFVMLTHLVTLLPVGTVAWRANFASAIFAALAASTAALVVAEILLAAVATQRPSGKKKAQPVRKEISPAIIVPAMVVAGLLLAFSRTLWAYATVTEVYALNTLLICAVLAVALRWRRTRSTSLLYAGAALAGASLGVHYLTAGFALLGVLVLVVKSGGLALIRSRTFIVAVLIGALTLGAVYLYLPLAGRGNPALYWGDPDDSRDFMRHVSAKIYRSYVTGVEGESQAGDLGRLVFREFAPPLLPAAIVLALIGLGSAFRHDRALFWCWIVIALATAVWFSVYPILDDEDAYLLPLFVVLATAAGYGAAVVARDRAAVAWALCAIPAIALIGHWQDRDRSDVFVGRDYAENTLRGIEPNAIVFTNDGPLWSTMLYLREAENVRRDVVPIQYGFLVRTWYLEHLERREPALAASVKRELDAYRPLLETFEYDEQRFRADTQLQSELVMRLGDLVAAMIASQVARGAHAYATADVALKNEGVEALIMRRIKSSYDFVPGGLAMEFLPRGGTHPVRNVELELRGLDDPKVRRTAGEVVERDIVPAYVTALQTRARYLRVQRQFDEAKRSYDEALGLDPGNEQLRRERTQLEQMRNR